MHIGAVHELTSEHVIHFAMWLDDIPFLEDPPFLHNDLYGHETTAKLKLVNRSLQQYIMLGGVCVLGRGAHAVSLKMHPRANPTSIYSSTFKYVAKFTIHTSGSICCCLLLLID